MEENKTEEGSRAFTLFRSKSNRRILPITADHDDSLNQPATVVLRALPEPIINRFEQEFIRSEQLSVQAQDSLALLKQRNPQEYLDLLTELNRLYVEDGLFFKPHHFDAIFRILHLQICLDNNVLSTLQTYVMQHEFDLNATLQALRLKYLPKLSTQANVAHLLHHTDKHAAEIKERAMSVITHVLNLFSDPNDKVDQFLQKVIEFMIECHDHEQLDCGKHGSIEQATSARIIGWLTTSPLGLPDLPEPVIRLLQFSAEYIITLGTTLVFSLKNAQDLSFIFHLIESSFKKSGILVSDNSNQSIIGKIRIAALITGVCDKMPAAILHVVERQAKNQDTNSLYQLQRYQPLLTPSGDLMLHQFFNNSDYPFQSYYPEQPIEENHQAFLLALVPKLCMQVEFGVKNEAEKAHAVALCDFVKHCQSRYETLPLRSDDVTDFFADFNNNFSAYQILEAVEALFFSREKIDIEKRFYLSQCLSLQKTQDEVLRGLQEQGYPEQLSTQTLFYHNMPKTDSDNLESLYQFYSHLDIHHRNKLVKELILNIILQAGTIYVKEYHASHPSSAENTPVIAPKKIDLHIDISSTEYIQPKSISLKRSGASKSLFAPPTPIDAEKTDDLKAQTKQNSMA